MDIIEQTILPAVNFMLNIRKQDKVAIVHGHDCDAVTSAAIFYRLIKKITGTEPSLVASESNFEVSEDIFPVLAKFDVVIVPDIAVVPKSFFSGSKPNRKILIIDHHPVSEYPEAVYSNPRLHDKDAYVPVSYLTNKIYRKILNNDESDWIAAIGTLGDHAVRNCLDLFEDLKAKQKSLIGKSKLVDEELYRKSLLGKITKMINSAQVVKEKSGASHAVKVLIGSKSYSNVLKESSLVSWTKEFDSEFGRLSKDFQKNKIESEKIVSYEVKSKLKLQSSLSGYLAQFFPGKIIVLYQKDGEEYNLSLRRGKGIELDLGQISKKITSIIPGGRGGGHPAAAGAKVPAKEIERFLNEISRLSA